MATRLEWDKRMLALARHVAQWSKDPSTKVGSVVVDHHHRILGVGYNGFPRGVKDLQERLDDRPTKYEMVVHAEVNALLNATGSTDGATLYATFPPCSECTKLIIQAGIARVVYPPPDHEFRARWSNSSRLAPAMLLEAGVAVEEIDDS